MRKALELAAGLEGSTTASYATQLLTIAIRDEVKDDPFLYEKWLELEKEAIENESWENVVPPVTINLEDLQASQALQQGWFLSGDNPNGYVVGNDQETIYKDAASGFIRSKQEKVTGFGTIMQQSNITSYHGKQLEYSAIIKTDKVKNWAGLWVRLDDADMQYLWFDNMQDRPIRGTIDWKKFHITFDVPNNSSFLNIGVLLVGPGKVWINNVNLDELNGNIKKSVDDLGLSLKF